MLIGLYFYHKTVVKYLNMQLLTALKDVNGALEFMIDKIG